MADLQQRSTAWHAARRGKLTASNLGAALGQVSYTSRAAAYRRALGTDKFQGNVATEWGTDNEPNAIVDYQTMTGNLVQATGLHVHPSLPWLAGSPDGFVGSEGMIEVKCPYYHRQGGRLHKQVPVHYYMQMNALLEITKREWCDYVCWAPEGMVVYRVKRDPLIFDFLLPYYGQFYAAMQVNADAPPPLSRKEKDDIAEAVKVAIRAGTDYEFYDGATPYDAYIATAEESDEEENCKRQRAEEFLKGI